MRASRPRRCSKPSAKRRTGWPPSSARGTRRLVELPLELADLLGRLFLAEAVALLDLAEQEVALALDGGQVVVGKLAPLFLDLALDLLPLALDHVGFHRILRSTFERMRSFDGM